MENSLNITHVPYSKELKMWLLNKNFHFFLKVKDKDYYLLTPFKDVVKLTDYKDKVQKLNDYKTVETVSINDLIVDESLKLNLSIGVLSTKDERAYVHLN